MSCSDNNFHRCWCDWQVIGDWLETFLISDVAQFVQTAIGANERIRSLLHQDTAGTGRIWFQCALCGSSLTIACRIAQRELIVVVTDLRASQHRYLWLWGSQSCADNCNDKNDCLLERVSFLKYNFG